MNSYIEIDFASVTSKKCFLIKKSKTLLEAIGAQGMLSVDFSRINILLIKFVSFLDEVKIIGPELHARDYHIIGTDLRNLTELVKKLTQSGVDFNVPTMFLTECVLVYMEPESTTMLLRWIVNNFNDVFFINYEQV